jgi:hypothetical protein
MPINFIPNDPSAASSAPGLRVQAKRPNRPAGRAGFTFAARPAEDTYPPGTHGFVFWQCREAALAALEAWESIAGPFTAWQDDRRRIALLHDEGVDLNAYYDRESVAFFHRTIRGTTYFSGASTDVVAHEVGHGLLDAIRPDLWDAAFLEAGAFHEAFGDCIAVLTALHDAETRRKLLAVTRTLRRRNFVESTAEHLAEGIRGLQPSHNAAEPRHAFNTFEYQIPETLPDDGGPGALINEVHSFGMLFSGCFYDLVASIFAGQSSKTATTLLASARTAGAILVQGASTALVTPRFFQSVGRAMVLADEQLTGGAHRQRIRNAFGRHGIRLGADALLAPAAVLEGAAPARGREALARATRRDLASRLGVPSGAAWSVEALDVSGRRFTRAVHTRQVPLGGVDRRLRGVTIATPVPVIIGESGGRAAVMGEIPEPVSTEREVHAFVASLVEHRQIEFPDGRPVRRGARPAAEAVRRTTEPVSRETHRIVGAGPSRRLVRRRFHCGCW